MGHGGEFRLNIVYWRRDRLPTPASLGFPGGSDGKESTCNTEDPGSVPGSGRSLGNGYLLQYSSLENPMDRRAWQAIVPAVPRHPTQLSNTSMQTYLESRKML